MRVAVIGWYGCGNFGHKAIAAGLLAGLRAVAPGATMQLFVPSYASRGSRSAMPPDVALLDLSTAAGRARLARDFDLVLVGGGKIETIFGPLIFEPGSQRSALRHAVKQLTGWRKSRRVRQWFAGLAGSGVPAIVHGVSFGGTHLWPGPLPAQPPDLARDAPALLDDPVVARAVRILTGEVLPGFRAVSLRGAISRTLLAAAAPLATGDPAFSITPPAAASRNQAEIERIAVCVQGRSISDQAFTELAAFLDTLIERGKSVSFVPMRASGRDQAVSSDELACRELARRMRHGAQAEWFPTQSHDVASFLADITRFDLVITMRLHLAILSGIAGRRLLPLLDEEPKMLEVLDGMGVAGNAVFLRRLHRDQLLARFESNLAPTAPAAIAALRASHETCLRELLRERLRLVA
jgi:hypothetical protein